MDELRPPSEPPRERTDEPVETLDLRPPRRAFVLAYTGVVLAGLLGAAIGAGLSGVLCTGDCTLPIAIGAVVGAAVAAGGVAIVAVLVLRAMAEWNTHQARLIVEEADRAADQGTLGGPAAPHTDAGDDEAGPRRPPTC